MTPCALGAGFFTCTDIKNLINNLDTTGNKAINGQITYDWGQIDTIVNDANIDSCETHSSMLKSGDLVRVNYMPAQTPPEFKPIVTEEKHMPQVLIVVTDLLGPTNAPGKVHAASVAANNIVVISDYQAKYDRSDITISLQDAANNDISNHTLEGLTFLDAFNFAVDGRLSSLSRETYSYSTKSFKSTHIPGSFYISLNFSPVKAIDSLGLINNVSEDWKRWADAVIIKGMVKPSVKPIDTVGLGIGFRPPAVNTVCGLLNMFSPFVAMTWSKDDKVDGGVLTGTKYGKPQITGGFSFNVTSDNINGLVGTSLKAIGVKSSGSSGGSKS